MSSISIAGDTSGSVILTVPAAAGSSTITLPAGTGTAAVQGVSTNIVSGTAQTAPPTTPQYFDFTGIPSWVKRITVMFNAVSTSGTSNYIAQIGSASGGIETSGYLASVSTVGASTATYSSFTAGFGVMENITAAANVYYGTLTICLQGSNLWVAGLSMGGNRSATGGGTKTLSSTLDRIRITTVNGTDTFDAGTINILYE